MALFSFQGAIALQQLAHYQRVNYILSQKWFDMLVPYYPRRKLLIKRFRLPLGLLRLS